MKISLCMIIKDEEKNIINCLDRALGIVDEAIIVDTGSTDRTKELLKEHYGGNDKIKVIEYIWENDFSKARNESLKYATGDWILILDADERLFADRKKIEDFLKNRNDKVYIIPIYNVMDRDNLTLTSSMNRLFKNDNPYFEGAIHEQINVDGERVKAEILDKDICKIYHYGYSPAVFQEKDKQNRNMDIIKDEIEKNPKDAFNWYNKGVMEMLQENYNIAIDDFLKSNDLTNQKRTTFHDDLILRIIQCLLMEKKYKKAINFIKVIVKDPYIKEIPDIYYYCGIAYISIKNYPMAIKYFKKAIDVGEYEKGTSKFGAGSFLPKLEWARILFAGNNKIAAIEKYKEAVFDKNNIKHQGIEDLRYLLQQENLIEELSNLETIISKEENRNSVQIANNDLVKYKNEVKENIRNLVERGMIADSKKLIKEYEEIVSNDIEMYSIKGLIAMMEGDMNKAEKILLEGLSINKMNFDLFYNLGYLYQSRSQKELAIKYYKNAVESCKNEEDGNIIRNILRELEATS